MLNILAFLKINSLQDNTPDKISPIGEISNESLSYSTQPQYYNNATYNNVELVAMSVLNGTQLTDIPSADAELYLSVGSFIQEKAFDGTITSDAAALTTLLTTQFTGKISNVVVGTMVSIKASGTTTDVYFPDSINFTNTTTSDTIRLWLSDQEFQVGYPLFSYAAVPPVADTNLDVLFESIVNTVEPLLKQRTFVMYNDQINEVSNKEPYSSLWSNVYTLHQFNDPTITCPTDWTLVVYGNGNNIVNAEEFLRQYILARSQHDENDWAITLPDLFAPNSFGIAPVWDITSAPDLTTQAEMYSCTVPYSTMLDYPTKGFPDFNPAQNLTGITVSTSAYQSLAFVCTGMKTNRVGFESFYKQFKDYLPYGTEDPFFQKMSTNTQEFVLNLLIPGLRYAETYKQNEDVPATWSRVIKGNLVYLVKSYKNVLYYIVTKDSYLKLPKS